MQDVPIVGSKDGATTLRILINEDPLVIILDYNQLMLVQRDTKNNYLDGINLVDVHWVNKKTGQAGANRCQSGQLKALDMRDNIDGTEKGITYYMDQLNRFTTVFAARLTCSTDRGTDCPAPEITSRFQSAADELCGLSGYGI